ncbi:MAG TPA: TonB-dependent receptor [Vicinamibacterales bacterium]|nr:TonB-dependent receptor [Vicinamibacterales bacterium]
MLLVAASAWAQGPAPVAHGVQARAASGSITGSVSDEGGSALPGAMVSALGATLASAVTDEAGRFTLTELPPGDYLVRVHLKGFSAASGAVVRVGPVPAVHRVELRRLDEVVGTAGTADAPVKTRPIIAAGFDLPRGAEPDADAAGPEVTAGDHPHTETAWRLRHIKRSILKDVAPIVVVAEGGELESGSVLSRAVGSAAGLASTLFADLPLSGEVNILTTGAVAPGAVLSATAFPRGVAYLALMAPGAGGDWSIRAAMSEGDLTSWIVSGAFASTRGGSHAYDFGLSYSTQEYSGGNPAALASVAEGSRNVGEIYAFDRWSLARALAVEYGGRYAHYDYLEQRALLSPRLAVEIEPFSRTRLRASAAQRMVAPGAEEFRATRAPGPSLPPERTFAPLGAPREAESFRVERARSYDVSLEREVGTLLVGVGRFYQSVDDQLVTLFGLELPGGPRSVGHYYVGTAGSFDAEGWGVRVETREDARIQASVRYNVTRAHWIGRGDLAGLRAAAPASIRPEVENLHDVTSSIKADISETATRIFVLYKVNSGFVRPTLAGDRPGVDGRFEVQVNQGLPLNFANTRWEVLVGLRNLFRDPTDPASVYDELLVVKPPMRLVGGFLVRF